MAYKRSIITSIISFLKFLICDITYRCLDKCFALLMNCLKGNTFTLKQKDLLIFISCANGCT